jgi:hypothetical protein
MIPMRISKKILAAVLAALMVIAMMPVTALAEYTGSTPILSKDLTVDDEWNTFEAWLEGPVSDYDGGCFNLTEDVHITEPIVIPENVHVQFDLNGFSIIGDVAGKMIQNHGTVEFVDYYGRGGQVYNTNVGGQGRDALINYGTLTIDADVWFGDNDKDMTNANPVNRGAAIRNYGTATINNGHYTACDNFTNGGYAYALINGDENANPIMTINNATVYGKNNGNVANNDGVVTINGGTFTLVKGSAQNGYNVYVWGDAVTDVVGGTFSSTGNTAAVCVDVEDYESAAINISGGSFTYNTKFKASSSTNNKVKVYGGTFSGDVSAYLDESCAQDVNGTVSQAYVAKVDSTKYANLEDAIAAASEGDTITLLADLDFTCYPRATKHVINLAGKTLDLNGKTVTTYNHSVVFVGDDFTIKNGSFVCETDPNFTGWNPNNAYSVVIYPEDYNSVNDDVYDYSTGVVLENLNLVGGVNCYGSEVTLREVNASATYLNVKGTTYYAVWADTHTTVTVESGTYSSDSTSANAVVACNKNDASSTLTITGGNFTVKSGQNLTLTGNRLLSISGGTFTYENGSAYTVPETYIAEGCSQDMETGTVSVDYEDTMSITVEDNIDLNINMDTSDDAATIEYTYSDPTAQDEEATKTVTKSASDDVTSFTVSLAPAQVMDDITAVAKDENGEVIRTVTTSIADYCNTIISTVAADANAFGAKSAELAELAKSTLDYGKAASDYFSYNTAAYSSYETQLADPTDDIADLATTAGQGWYDHYLYRITGVSYVATSVPELRFYFESDYFTENDFSDFNEYITCENGTAKFVKLEGTNQYILQVKNINITDFTTPVVVRLSGEESEGTEILRFTPIVWVNAAIQKTGTALGELGKAIGNYYLASDAYFD